MTGDLPEQPGSLGELGPKWGADYQARHPEYHPDDPGHGEALPEKPCLKLRPHLGPHTWFGAQELRPVADDQIAAGVASGAVAITQLMCPGVPGVSAEFLDRQEVTVVRCYGGDDPGARCKRMLVFDGGPGIADTDMHGWTVREHYAGGVGDRVWACGVHS